MIFLMSFSLLLETLMSDLGRNVPLLVRVVARTHQREENKSECMKFAPDIPHATHLRPIAESTWTLKMVEKPRARKKQEW
jgi:hypothetical protein